jgi:hypothetical protein
MPSALKARRLAASSRAAMSISSFVPLFLRLVIGTAPPHPSLALVIGA